MLFQGVSIPNSLVNVRHVRICLIDGKCLLTTRKGVEIANATRLGASGSFHHRIFVRFPQDYPWIRPLPLFR